MLKLCMPTINDKEDALSYVEELKNIIDADGTNSLYVTCKLNGYDIWLKEVINSNRFKTFFVKDDDNKIVGVVTLRLKLDKAEKTCGGNIGLNIRPSKRGNGYASEALDMILKYAYALNMEKVIIDCRNDNIKSINAIERLGLNDYEINYNELLEEDIRRYYVNLLELNNSYQK